MNNPSLVPKQVTDKNGVLTTRWVKPDLGAKSTAKIPAPVSGTKPVVTPRLDALFKASMLGMEGEVSVEELDIEARRTVESLIEKAMSDNYAASNVRNLLVQAFISIGESGNRDFTAFNNVAALGESVAFSYNLTDLSIDLYVNGLDQFAHINDFHTEATEEELAQARALCRVTASLSDEYLDSYMGYSASEYEGEYDYELHEEDDTSGYFVRLHPRYKGLSDLIMKYPSRVDDIVDTIKKRRSTDAVMIEQVISHKEAALREGTL